VINARISSVVPMERAAPVVRRPGIRFFWLLFVAEGLLIVAALIALLSLVPQRTPLASGADTEVLRAAVLSRLDGAVSDPVIEVAPGVTARSSAVRGFALNGVTYFYYFEDRRGLDPLSRGKVTERDVEVLLRESDGERTLVIYRLLNA
jgi:hypothetical protein